MRRRRKKDKLAWGWGILFELISLVVLVLVIRPDFVWTLLTVADRQAQSIVELKEPTAREAGLYAVDES